MKRSYTRQTPTTVTPCSLLTNEHSTLNKLSTNFFDPAKINF